jgi:sulfite reductase alpha subunit-like flavoprotein
LEFNKRGELKQTKLFKDKSLDQKFVALSLPLHTGEIMGWYSLIVYFIVTIIGALLPVTGTLIWYRRKTAQKQISRNFRTKSKNKKEVINIETKNWLIIYGTKSGNSKLVAKEMQQYFRANGLNVNCRNISTLTIENLYKLQYLFVVISTDGKGVPPPSAQQFFKQLATVRQKSLANLTYAICALGDSSYEHFCETGKKLDKNLSHLGAQYLIPRTDCDNEFAEKAILWIRGVWDTLAIRNNINGNESKEITGLEQKQFNKASLNKLQQLTIGKNESLVYHIELLVNDDISEILPGDSIEIKPVNPEWLAEKIAKTVDSSENQDLIRFLATQCEITKLSKSTLKKYYSLTTIPELKSLLGNEAILEEYLSKANILDVLMDFVSDINADELKRILPRLKTRFYSVASSTSFAPKQLDLTIKSVRFDFKKRKHEGAASIQLTEQFQIGSMLNYRHYANLDFRIPANKNIPLIMIGVGTGIAPFRAFLQAIKSSGSDTLTWLIWGDKYRKTDFIYEDELRAFQQDNILNKLNVTFSRNGDAKVYVQDLLMQNKSEFIAWIENGAHVYVCGSIAMGQGVRKAIQEITKFAVLENEGRYHEDIY